MSESEKHEYFDEAVKLLGPDGNDFTVRQSLSKENGQLPVLLTALTRNRETITSEISIDDNDKVLSKLQEKATELADDLVQVRNMVAGYVYTKTGQKPAITPGQQSERFKEFCIPILGDYLEEYFKHLKAALAANNADKALETLHPVVSERRLLQFIHKYAHEGDFHLDKIEKDILGYDEEFSKFLLDYEKEIHLRHERRLVTMTTEAALRITDQESAALHKLGNAIASSMELYCDLWIDSARQLRQHKKIDTESFAEESLNLEKKIVTATRAYNKFCVKLEDDPVSFEGEHSEPEDMRPLLEDMAANAKVFTRPDLLREHIEKDMDDVSVGLT
jgi:hypothetical protein